MAELQSRARSTLISSASRQKACSSCIKAKRRCDLYHPSCRRCISKGITCHYPSLRLHDRHTAGQRAAAASAAAAAAFSSAHSTNLATHNHYYRNPPFRPPSPLSSSLPDSRHDRDFCEFFLSPGSWTVFAGGSARPVETFDISLLMNSVQQVQRWLKQWVSEGSTMFIHRTLYRERLPKCIQDAYMAGAAYFSRTETNQAMVLRIIEERVAQLLQEHNEQAGSCLLSNVFDHLARVQALLVYQVLRLYDGDVRQRAMAEELIPTLTQWSMQMIRCASLSSEYVRAVKAVNDKARTAVIHSRHDEREETSAWKTWILAESVRRTWLVAGHIQCIYGIMRHQLSSCPGGLMFTTRAGLWEASTAFNWWKTCREQDMLFLHSLDAGNRLFPSTRPEEVDEFGRFVITIVSEQDKVESWMKKGKTSLLPS